MGPPAGNGAELQFALAPFHAPELADLELVFQILCGLEQRGFERVVSSLGVQGRSMNQQRSLPRMAGGLGVLAWAGYLQPHLDAECRSGFQLVFEDNLGGAYRRQAVQVFELFLHLAVPGGLGVEADVSECGFHIASAGAFAVAAGAQRASSILLNSLVTPYRMNRYYDPIRRPARSFRSPGNSLPSAERRDHRTRLRPRRIGIRNDPA